MPRTKFQKQTNEGAAPDTAVQEKSVRSRSAILHPRLLSPHGPLTPDAEMLGARPGRATTTLSPILLTA